MTTADELEDTWLQDPKEETVDIVFPLFRKVSVVRNTMPKVTYEIVYEKVIDEKRCIRIQHQEMAGKVTDIRIREIEACWTGPNKSLILGRNDHELSEEEWNYLCVDIKSYVGHQCY